MSIKNSRVAGMAPSSGAIASFEETTEVLAQFDIGSMWQRLMGEAISEYVLADRQGLAGEEMNRHLQEFMDKLSDKPVEALARETTTITYNEGRGVAIETAKAAGLADIAVRSEVLDENTCEQCASLDGYPVEIDSEEYQTYMPPSFCFGGERCRGFYVVVPRGELT